MLRFVKSDICLVHDYCKVSLRPADAGAKETGGRPQAPAKGRLPIGADLSDSLPPAAASEEKEKLGTPQTPAGDFAPCTPLRPCLWSLPQVSFAPIFVVVCTLWLLPGWSIGRAASPMIAYASCPYKRECKYQQSSS